jgi:multiple sugar transport system substrate-binding protein
MHNRGTGILKSRQIVIMALIATATMVFGYSAPARAASTVTISFSQWWEPELPAGALRSIIDTFEKQNAGIKVKLVSGPYSATKAQTIAGAATGTMSDVVGLDGAWVSDLAKQGALASLDTALTRVKFPTKQLAGKIKVGTTTYMIPVVNYIYPLFTNDDLLKKAGINSAPTNRTQFAAAAKAVSGLGGNVSGWVIPLSQSNPNGIQNDIMSLVWASGGSMLKAGKPNLTGNAEVKSVLTFVKGMWDAGSITKGAFTLAEPDKVTEFTNGRAGMMIDSLSHITQIKTATPDLNFSIHALPKADAYSGKGGIPYASWGIGISKDSKYPVQAAKLLAYLMSTSVNTKLADLGHAFPGNTLSVPTWVSTDPMFKTAFTVYQSGYPANEFTGLPKAEDLMLQFDIPFQKYLSGTLTADQMLAEAQKAWLVNFKK